MPVPYQTATSHQACDFVVDLSPDRKPVQLMQYVRDVITSSGAGDGPCGGDLDRLRPPNEAARHAVYGNELQ